jgi:hypothetical protein
MSEVWLGGIRAERNERSEQSWLGGRDSNPDNGVQSAVSYR